MSEREMIKQACDKHGLTIKSWDTEHENGLTAKLGHWTVTTPDYENDGLYDGDIGELLACVVGAEKYNNQRVSFSFVPEGCDGGSEVSDLYALEPAE